MPDIYPSKVASMVKDDYTYWINFGDFPNSIIIGNADSVDTTSAHFDQAIRVVYDSATGYDLSRYYMVFDTSGITETPLSATLKLYGKSGTASNIIAVRLNTNTIGSISSDFDVSDWGQTYVIGGAETDQEVAYSAQYTGTWSTSGYNQIALNATALSDMVSLSTFRLVIMDYTYDRQTLANANPAFAPPDGTNVVTGFYSLAAASAANRPVISYTTAGGETPAASAAGIIVERTIGSSGRGFSTNSISSPVSGGRVVGNGFKTNGF